MENQISANYYKSLPKKRMAAGVLIRDEEGKMLILKTTYKNHWEIPGGVVEKDESPRQCAERETLEEIGLKINITQCLVINYRSKFNEQDENIMFIFDGGVLSGKTDLKLDNKEISEAQFVSFEEATELVGERISSRLPFCKKAIEEKRTVYLESIGSIEPTFIS